MNKQETNKLVPKLRFPDFRGAGEWKKNTLGNVADIITGNTPDTTEPDNYGGTKMFVSPGDMTDIRYISRTKTTLSEAGYLKTRHVKENSVLFVCIGSTIGKIAQNKFECATNQQINSIVPNEGYSSDFIYSILENEVSKIADLAGIQAVPIINKSTFSSVLVPFPSPDEQQKIADCLTSIDDLITAQIQKLDKLKSHKKGLMQRLFPADGETVPKLRFPEFQDVEEWKSYPLKSVFTIFQGFAFSSDDNVTIGIKWLKIADVGIQQMNHNSPSFLPEHYKKVYQKFLVKKGDYVIALTRPILNRKLKMAQVDEVFHESLLNQRVGKLVTSKNISFVYYLLQTSKLIWDIEKNIAGSEPPNLSAQQIEDLETYIPSPEEQKKIADCLSSIDDLITAQGEKIDALKTHKKGLMQQLFPSG